MLQFRQRSDDYFFRDIPGGNQTLCRGSSRLLLLRSNGDEQFFADGAIGQQKIAHIHESRMDLALDVHGKGIVILVGFLKGMVC